MGFLNLMLFEVRKTAVKWIVHILQITLKMSCFRLFSMSDTLSLHPCSQHEEMETEDVTECTEANGGNETTVPEKNDKHQLIYI